MKLDPTSPRPFRTLLALMDKHEVGAVLADRLVLPALKSIYMASTEADSNIRAEVSVGLAVLMIAIHDGECSLRRRRTPSDLEANL